MRFSAKHFLVIHIVNSWLKTGSTVCFCTVVLNNSFALSGNSHSGSRDSSTKGSLSPVGGGKNGMDERREGGRERERERESESEWVREAAQQVGTLDKAGPWSEWSPRAHSFHYKAWPPSLPLLSSPGRCWAWMMETSTAHHTSSNSEHPVALLRFLLSLHNYYGGEKWAKK